MKYLYFLLCVVVEPTLLFCIEIFNEIRQLFNLIILVFLIYMFARILRIREQYEFTVKSFVMNLSQNAHFLYKQQSMKNPFRCKECSTHMFELRR